MAFVGCVYGFLLIQLSDHQSLSLCSLAVAGDTTGCSYCVHAFDGARVNAGTGKANL